MSTKLWTVRAALVTQFTAALAGHSTEVYPGPRVRNSGAKKFLLVGSDGGDTGFEATEDGMNADQVPSNLGPGTWQDEAGAIVCAAWAWSGNSTLTSVQTSARDVFDTCTAALRADRTLGGLLALPGLARLSSVGVREAQPKSGPFVRITFSVDYGALITS
jgi:hypothetical protein